MTTFMQPRGSLAEFGEQAAHARRWIMPWKVPRWYPAHGGIRPTVGKDRDL